MRSLAALLLCCALSACATGRADKVPLLEPAPEPPPAPPARRPAPKPKKDQRHVERSDEVLERTQVAVTRFAARARSLRAQTRRGQPMPAEAHENWEALLSQLDALSALPAHRTSSHDVMRARVVTDAELEMDARAYRDFPPELIERAQLTIAHLGVRMAELRQLKPKALRRRKVDYSWPVTPTAVTSLFGRRLHPISKVYKPHLGIDLAAHPGQLVTSAGSGVVTFAGWHGAHGQKVHVRHADGAVTSYSHLSMILIEVGTEVQRGDPVGLAGKTGQATGVHLHFEFLRNGRQVDPLNELGHPARVPVALR